MWLTKSQVLACLKEDTETYQDDLTALNILPKDAVFELSIEETIFAEYFNKDKNELIRFELNYERMDQRDTSWNEYKIPQEEIESTVSKEINQYYNKKERNKDKEPVFDKVVAYTLITGVAIIVVALYIINKIF